MAEPSPGPSSAHSRCWPTVCDGAARTWPTAPGIAIWPRAPRCACCARSRPRASSARGGRRHLPAGQPAHPARRAGPRPAVADRPRQPALERSSQQPANRPTSVVAGHADTALYIAMVEGTHAVRHTSWVGRAVPLGQSAAGDALRGAGPRRRLRGRRTRRRARRHRDRGPDPLAGPHRRRAEPGRPHLPDRRQTRRRNTARSLAVAAAEVSAPAEPHCRMQLLRRRTVSDPFDSVSKKYPDGTVAVDDLDARRPRPARSPCSSGRRAAARPHRCG